MLTDLLCVFKAHDAGEPEPTMPEWLAANPSWDFEPAKAATLPGGATTQEVTIPNDAFSFD